MESHIIILSLLTALCAAGFVLRPVLQPDSSDHEGILDAEFHNLLDQKERCLQVLRDLELDLGTGKIEQEEYSKMKKGMMAEVATVLKQLDQYRDEHS